MSLAARLRQTADALMEMRNAMRVMESQIEALCLGLVQDAVEAANQPRMPLGSLCDFERECPNCLEVWTMRAGHHLCPSMRKAAAGGS